VPSNVVSGFHACCLRFPCSSGVAADGALGYPAASTEHRHPGAVWRDPNEGARGSEPALPAASTAGLGHRPRVGPNSEPSGQAWWDRGHGEKGNVERRFSAVRVQQQKLGQGYWPPAEHDLLAIG
jgi:hypothetical protein